MSKKIVAMLMAVAMAFSLLPVTAFAAGETQEGNSQPVTESKNNLTMTKTVTPKGNGTYTVQLESYATGSVTPTQAPVPMDFVLVLDVSGSMKDKIASYDYRKTEKTSWSAKDFYFTGTTYYEKIGEEYYLVSCQRKSVPNQYIGSHYEYWLEANGQPLGNTGEWGEQLYSGSLYTYGKVSGSQMSKLKAMQTAVNSFIDSVAAQKNGDDPVAHRISIVKFAGDKKNTAGNDTYNEYGNTYNYTQKVKELTDVTAAGSVASLKTAVNNLTAGGATAADWGMQKAKDVLTNRENKENPSIVIMFTDGEPNHGSGYSKDVAGDTVDIAKTLKAAGTKVYTIGMFNGADPDDTTTNFNKYMNGVSSNYPEAVKANNNSGVTLGAPAEGNYYFKADNAGDLDQVFQKISHVTTTTSPLDASAVVVDNVPSNFALTEGSVKVYTANCIVKNGEEFTWDKATQVQTITPNSTKNDDGSQTISTTGFDFSKNWYGLDENKQARGQKLIIEFTIECTNYGGTQPTNAGAYIKAKEADETPIISLDNPQVPVTISLGSKENSLKNPEVEDEKPYDGTGLAILPKIAEKANALATGTDNAYVDMELTVKVDDTTTYTYEISAGKKTGSWYKDSSTDPMTGEQIAAVRTPKDVNRDQGSKEVKPYTYKFDLKLSDVNPKDAESGAKSKKYQDNNASFKIKPVSVTVKADDKQVTRGTAPNSIPYTATVTGLVNDEAESLISRTIQCESYTVDTPVTSAGSELAIIASGAEEQGNYTVTYKPGKLTVVAAPVTTGTLKVTKEVQGENLTLDNLSDEFAITVTDDQGSAPTTLKLTDNNVEKDTSNTTATWTISDLPTGTYTVSEENADVNDYDCTAAYASSNETDTEKSVTVTENRTSTMTVTNTYTEKEVEPPTPPTPADPVKWDVSRSKIASGLTKNSNGEWTTDVTLSLPSAEEELASDVVFVLDKSTSAALEQQALDMLTKLKEQAEGTKAKVKVGVVIFNKQANVTPLTDLATGYETIKAAIEKDLSSGTNTHAGLLAGKQMLEEDTTVDTQRKYLIFVSDGITYMYNAEPTVTAWSFMADSWNHWAGPDNWKSKYGNNNPPADWSAWMTEIGTQVEAQGTEYEYPYDGTATKWTLEDNTSKNCANSIDKALYLTYQVYQEAQTEGYNCYAVVNGSSTNYLWGPAFMNYLADGKTVNFDKIQNDILYAVSVGSTVTDTIGDDFTLVGEEPDKLADNSFTLTVKDEKIPGMVTGDTVNFGTKKDDGSYPYTVTYVPTTKTFTWTINEDVSNFAPVQLTYTVKLTTPKTAAGTHGVTDLNGDGIVDGTESTKVVDGDALYTNERATMVPKDSDGNTGAELTFPKPSVSYKISSGSSGSHSGGSRPSLNTKDHYGYIIGYPVDYYTGQPTTDQTKKPVRPEGKITRAEVATIYFRMLTDESRTKFWSQSNAYSDVKAGDWFNNAVSTLSNAGIIAGYEDGSFRPNGYITRAEFATIAARFFDVTYNGKDLFPDISGHWAKDYINQAANKGFVNGYEDGTFKPDRNITRAEAVTLVNRTLDRHPDKNHFTKDMLVWPDNMDQTKWYYADMQEATNSHTYQMKENSDKTKYENWTKTLPIRNWEALEKAWSNANSSQGNGNVV